MNNSELEKNLRTEAATHTPDVFDRIMREAETTGAFERSTIADSTATAKRNGTGKKRLCLRVFMPIATAVACAAVVLPIALINDNGGDAPSSALPSVARMYAMGAATSARLLASIPTSGTSNAKSVSTSAETDDLTEVLSRYIEAFNGFFDNEYEVSASTVTDGVYPFDNALTVTATGFDGETFGYNVYYSEALQSSKASTDGDDKNKPNESGSYFALKGLAVIDGNEFTFDGYRDASTDDKAQGFTVKLYGNASNKSTYVEIVQSSDGDELAYTLVSDGQIFESTAVSFNEYTKDGKNKTELKFKFSHGKLAGEYKIKLDKSNGETAFDVQYDNDDKSGTFKITLKEGKYDFEI